MSAAGIEAHAQPASHHEGRPSSAAASCLTVVIPALDEEEVIGATIERCLAARATIVANTDLSAVEIIVVNDGSTDRTQSIAESFDEVTVLKFDENRGYGAAIKCGFEHGRGDLVGFLDADGTCDPVIFVDLCNRLADQDAHVALGSRMSADSEMPRIRRVGNTLFAWMLGILSKRVVGDTASGMRVIRRDSLPDLYPLPDGLHFTPAMSARVLLEDRLRLVEVPMPYAERVGRSKLSVVKDGVRFLTVISRAAICYRPGRLLLLASAALALLAFAVGVGPVWFFINNDRVEDWMIYRILFCSLLATCGGMLVCAAVVSQRAAATVHEGLTTSGGVTVTVGRLFARRWRWLLSGVLVVVAVAIVWPGILEYIDDGAVEMHWSRAVLSSLLIVAATMIAITSYLLNMMELVQEQRVGPVPGRAPDRVKTATR